MSPQPRPLDFLCIGAAKAGTTSLFHYLQSHRQIWIPPGKEVPYFTKDSWETEWPSYFEFHFANAPPRAQLGKVTPQYMADPRIPARVAELMPDVKILVLLRDPVERAHSDWRMRVRNRSEHRPFEEAVAQQLDEAQLARGRGKTAGDGIPPEDLYLCRGEYGRILTPWLEKFDRQRVVAIFSEHLESRTLEVMEAVAAFLQLSGGFRQRILEQKYHRVGDTDRLPGFSTLKRSLSGNFIAKRVWHLLPKQRRLELLRWFSFNVRFGKRRHRLDPATRSRLVEFFHDDVRRLETLLGETVPWTGFHD